jgi:hypothetical protein
MLSEKFQPKVMFIVVPQKNDFNLEIRLNHTHLPFDTLLVLWKKPRNIADMFGWLLLQLPLFLWIIGLKRHALGIFRVMNLITILVQVDIRYVIVRMKNFTENVTRSIVIH